MSITIKKFKNIYGIKNISSIIRFKKNNFIYASNGTMKTSFSDGMYKILNNQVIEPEFRDDGLSEFAIDIDGTNYSKQDIPTDKIRTITFKNEFNLNLMIDKNLLYVISLDLQKLLQEKENLRSKIYEQVKVFFNDSPVKSLKKNDQESFAVSNIEIENILNIFEQIKNYDIDHTINDIDLIKFYNDKALILLEEPELAKKIETYNNFIDKKIKNTEIFTNVFGLDQLKDVIDKCIRIHFFDAGHKLNMNSKNYNEIESIKLYDEELKKIYNDQISKDKFESIKRQIKNNATKEMAKYLEQNKHFLKYLPNKKMIDVIIFNQFKIYENYREEIEEMILKFNQINSEIDKVIKNEKNN
jgi:hypothetical protein